MRDTKPSPLLTGLLYFVITSIVSVLTPYLTGSSELLEAIRTGQIIGNVDTFTELFSVYNQHINTGGMILSFALDLCITVIGAGFTWYCLNVARGGNPVVQSIFDGFGRFLKVIWLSIVTGFFVFVWSLLFVIPGIIAAYRYSQAVNVMYDHPEYGALECIRESKKMMRGYKGSFFILQLSFIGWYLLSAVIITVIQIVSPNMSIIGSVLNIWLTPYMGIASALFYVQLQRGNQPYINPRDL